MRLQIHFVILLSLFLPSTYVMAQDVSEERESPVDSLYREDQFYIGVTYNLLGSRPDAVNLRGLSGGVHLGYLRDMPINKRRNVAIAIGAGLAFDSYGQNLFIGEDENENTIFRVLDAENVDFDRNRFSTFVVEAPIEFRWRTSTPSSYKFWRIHAGFRVGYTYFYKATFKQPGNTVGQTDIPEFEPLRLAATLSFGYNTFNFYAQYHITPFFKDAETSEGDAVELRGIKVGLIFYIL
jgi:hypothetical protein